MEGPIPIVRRENQPWPDVQKAFHAAALERGYAVSPDLNGPESSDQRCRVRGVQGLWVADSSIMPQVTRANTNATAIMIRERVADWIAAN